MKPDDTFPLMTWRARPDNGEITIADEFGLILRSDDAGGSWRVLHRGDASIFGLTLGGDGRGYAVGQVGTVLRTDDNGKSWTKLSSGRKANLLPVPSVPPDGAGTGRAWVRERGCEV